MTQVNKSYYQADRFTIALMTLTCGFVNAYTYVNHGGSFASFHTGNLIKLSLSFTSVNTDQPIIFLVPILGALIGSVISSYLLLHSQSGLRTHQLYLMIEMLTFSILCFIKPQQWSTLVLMGLSALMMIQLTGFRKFHGTAFNSTIMTGNLRNLGEYLAKCIYQPSQVHLLNFIQYLVLLLCFPLGAILGAILSQAYAQYSILACLLMTGLALLRTQKSV